VPEEDPAALADAIAKLVDDREFHAACKANLAAARQSLQWDETMEPLIRFCSEPASPLSPKWERMPGLVLRIAGYMGRRTVYNLFDRQLKRRSERKEAAERRAALAAGEAALGDERL
jgi:hypothetical protein